MKCKARRTDCPCGALVMGAVSVLEVVGQVGDYADALDVGGVVVAVADRELSLGGVFDLAEVAV